MKRMRRIKDFPDYAITRDGEVWRVTPTELDANRYGEVPRQLGTIWLGTPGCKKAGVTLWRRKGVGKVRHTKKTILSLLKATYPEGYTTFKDEIRRD